MRTQRNEPLLVSGAADTLVALWQPEKSLNPLALGALSTGVTKVAWSRTISSGGHARRLHVRRGFAIAYLWQSQPRWPQPAAELLA